MRLVQGPKKPLSFTALTVLNYYRVNFSLNFLIKEDIKHERLQNKLSIKKSFLLLQ